MADMILCDRLDELWHLIQHQHLLYLELEESPRKIDQRYKLESYIKEYLSLAPQERKFTLRQTADVLHRSAGTKDNFSGYRAALAWKAIGKYADNLVAQPWRKEYRDIKLYCGFYKHEIEESLVGAELMFEAMGYRHAGHSTMSLPGVLDPDRVISVSKDAIVAYVECQIMKHIWEAVSAIHAFTWLEILEFRENHTGTADQAIRGLSYKVRQRQYHEQYHEQYHDQCHEQYRPRAAEPHHGRPECLHAPHPPHTPHTPHPPLGYYNHMHYPQTPYTVPTRYAPVVSPQQIVPPPVIFQTPLNPYPSHHVIKPHDLYPSNGYHMHYQPQINVHNGYGVSQPPQMPLYSVGPGVPTGQLIELESSPAHGEDRPSHGRHARDDRWETRPDPQLPSVPSVPNVPSVPSGKARDDGAGSWENWDYVYRNLESHGYKKDLGSRGDVLAAPQHAQAANHEPAPPSDLSDKMKRLTVEPPRETKVRTEGDGEAKNKPLPRSQLESEVDGFREVASTSKLTVNEGYADRLSPDKSRKDSVRRVSETGSVTAKTIEAEVTKTTVNFEVLPVRDAERSKSRSRTPEVVATKWECCTCTFLNAASRDICEMCYKSREKGSELKPQPSGGHECSKCTLVNEPKATHCAACDTSLENASSYV